VGRSIRDLQEALYRTFGHVLSREAVNRVTIAAQSPMQRWRARPITDTLPLLIVDGVWVQILAPITTDAHASFEAPTRAEAEQRLVTFRATGGQLEPEVVRLLAKEIDLSLTFYQFAVSLHPLVRSTNLLERFFREFRTKAAEIGSFPNALTCLTVFHLIVVRDHAKHDRGKVAQTG
jgi:transposase-like protein